MIKGILIDFGGTIDSDGIHWFNAFQNAYSIVAEVPEGLLREAYVHAERILGRNPIITPDFTFRQTLQIKIFLQSEYLQKNGIPIQETARNAILDYCYNRVVHHISAVAKPVLEKIQLPLVLVTNFYGNMHTVLEEFDLNHLFKDIIESSVVGVRKPDPEIFRMGVKALGLLPQEAIMIGDSPDKDIIPAQSIGCQTIWLRGKSWSGTNCTPDRTILSLAEIQV